MTKVKMVMGFDPDSKAHGVAVYQNKELIKLKSMTLIEIIDYIKSVNREFFSIEAHIENVCGVSASFTSRDSGKGSDVKLKMAQHVGMCKQSQVELERALSYYGIPTVKHKISKRWKSAQGKVEFHRLTGWTGRSNEDTRSAAYFGFLGAC